MSLLWFTPDPEDEEIKNNKKLREWLDFFKDAHHKESIPLHIEESIQKAYELIRVDILKKKKPELLQDSKKFFQSLNAHNKTVKEEGRKEGKIENMEISTIMRITGLSEQELLDLGS